MLAILMIAIASVAGPPGRVPGTPSGQVIQAVGIGYPPPGKGAAQGRLLAQRAAEVGAMRNLARLAGNQSPILQGFRFVSKRVRPDGSVEVVAEMRIGRSLPARTP